MNHASLQEHSTRLRTAVRTLNGWQRGAVATTAAVIAYFQFRQFVDWSYDGDGWFVGFALAGLLLFAALASPPPASGANAGQRAMLGVTAAAIAMLQLARLNDGGGEDSLSWAWAFLTAGAFVVGAASGRRKHQLGVDPPSDEEPLVNAAMGTRLAGSVAAPAGARPPPLPKRICFRETDVERFIATCNALAKEVAPALVPRGMPMVPALAGYVEEVALGFSYGVCSVVACVHNQQWPQTNGSAEVTERIVHALTRAGMKGEGPELAEEKACAVAKGVAADYLKAAEIAAFGFCKLANEESHQFVRGLASAAKEGKAPELQFRAPSGKQVLAGWLSNPHADENHLAFVQAILAKAVGAEFRGADFRERLEGLYGPLTRSMIERAVLSLEAPLTDGTPSNAGRTMPKLPTDAEVEALVSRHRKLLADARSSGDPRDFAPQLRFCPPESSAKLNKGLWVCGCCWAPFKIDPEKVGLWFSTDHKGAPVALCAVCLEYLNYHQASSTGGGKQIVIAAEYDGMGQDLAVKLRGQPPAKVAVLRMAMIEHRERESGQQE